MVRVLCHAVAACVLVGWFAPDGRVIGATADSRRLHVGRGSVAAGRAHSVLATPEGRVSSWGSGGRGQIGDGALVDRWVPTAVPSVSDVAVVSAGAAHTVAVTKGGEVYAWGANGSGRLGDGTRKRRTTPVRVRGLTNVIGVAAGRAHTLALTADGQVFAWGRNQDGQLGVGNRVTSLVPVHLRDLSGVVAIAAGDAHSMAITRDGDLFTWGGNRFSSLGDGTSKDRLRPVAIALHDVVSVAAGDGHSLALLRTGAVFSWGRGANGELGTGITKIVSKPAIIPGLKASAIAAGRRFSAAVRDDGKVVAWGANESGQLGDRTTTRRLRPVVVAGVSGATSIALGDAHAIAVTVSGDVHTWGAGGSGQLGSGSMLDRSSATEIVSDLPDWGLDPEEDDEEPRDVTPPTITITTTPPLQSGWMRTPVTVTFECADDVGIASCPVPAIVSTDGYAQQISGTAVDLAGNHATASVVINVDLSPPQLTITEPAQNAEIDAEQVVVTGTASDIASGLADGRCNSEPAEIVDGLVRCSVHLYPGRNEIVLHAIDVVGRNSSASISVTRVGASTSLTLTPSMRGMVLSEEAKLSLRDEFGADVQDALWSSSDDEVVSLSGDDPPMLTASSVGTTTITASKDGMIATASIIVSDALAPGTTRWSLPPALPRSAAPLFANRVDAASPDMFTVESAQWDDATLRAVTADGEVLWQQHVPGVPFMGDAFGGVVAGIFDVNQDIQAYARIGGGSIMPWRYQSIGRLGTPAQAHDGTIYAIESSFGGLTIDGQEIWDKHAIVIDGAAGTLVSRTPFHREVESFTAEWDGLVLQGEPPIVCRSWYNDIPPETLGPVVGSDGRGYFIVRRHAIHMQAKCDLPFRRRPDRTIDMGLDLVIVARDVEPQTINLFSTTCAGAEGSTLPCDLPVQAFQIMPDGIGGMLVTWQRGTEMVGDSVFVQRSMTRVTAEGAVNERSVSPQFWLEMMGQAGTAFTYDAGWTVMDIATGTIKWTGPLPNLAMLAARPDGGIAALDVTTGELKVTNAAGEVERKQPLGLDVRAVQQGGDWIGLRSGALTAVVGDFPDATRWRALSGNAQGQLSLRRPGIGLTLKSQRAIEPLPVHHTAIKIAPIRQDWMEQWYAARPNITPQRDEFENLFIMLGAGLPDGRDSTLNCAVPGMEQLVSDTNRDGDLTKAPRKWTKLPVSEPDEFAAIQRLMDLHDRFTDKAPYACFPDDLNGFYNSNSYVHSLLIHAAVPHDEAQPRFPSPGWKTKIPSLYFPPR